MNRSEEIRNEIIEKLSNSRSLTYSKLFRGLKTIRSDRTFRIYLKKLEKERILDRKESQFDGREVEYSIRGVKLEKVLEEFKKKDKKLMIMQNELRKMIRYYVYFRKTENKKKTKKNTKRVNLLSNLVTRRCSSLTDFVFQNSHVVLFLKLSGNYPLYKESEKIQEKQYGKLVESIDLLRKMDYEAYEKIMNFLQLRTNIKITGFTT